jgi:hypothetical protein
LVFRSATRPMPWTLASSTARAIATARARNRRSGPLSALRAHTNAPHKTDLPWETLRPLNRPGQARTVRVVGPDATFT